ncbi:MAG: lipoyl(octanoyl) transferase LipB [Alphaproteobacteria bacterium]|nr:lipoyl(octanoyl) transferase LipB [Alphaproteobacteria bacterium]
MNSDDFDSNLLRGNDKSRSVDWRRDFEPVPYPYAIAEMEARVQQIVAKQAAELVWLLEHPPLYTAGTSAKPEDLLLPEQFPVYATGRGGQYTYHGPGQRIAYLMLDLDGSAGRERDIRRYIQRLEAWVIRVLLEFGVVAESHPERVGVWVKTGDRMDKIAAIGVRLRHWVTYHGVAINLSTNLDDYAGILPCGIADAGVCSLKSLGRSFTVPDFDEALFYYFGQFFAGAGACAQGAPTSKS